MKGQEVKIDPKDEEVLKPLREFWSDPNLDANEKFLRDYVLNNKYMKNESYNTDLKYNEMIHDSDENLSEDEKTIQKQEEFERKYNFRFEEPDQEFIKKYVLLSYDYMLICNYMFTCFTLYIYTNTLQNFCLFMEFTFY